LPSGSTIIHLIGPGGAGKTTSGEILAELLDRDFIDVDRMFLKRQGHIASFIDAHGYAAYARRNVALYSEVRAAIRTPAVIAMSSGFMTYPAMVDESYPAIRAAIERDPCTVLLLPSLDVNICVEILVPRQLARPYLDADEAHEERRVRERHPIFLELACQRYIGLEDPASVASRLAQMLGCQ